MTVPLEVIGFGGDAEPGADDGARVIEGRSLGQIAWMRLKRDRVALGGGVVVVLLILMRCFAPLIVKLLGHPPNEFHYDQVDARPQVPIGRVRRHQLALPVRRRAGQRPRPVQPGRVRLADLVADRLPGHAAVGGDRHRAWA